jgi:hypothetical protein
MTFATLVADRTVMRMVRHQEFDDRLVLPLGTVGLYRDVQAFMGRLQAGDDDPRGLAFLLGSHFHRAEPARPEAPERGVIAEVGNVHAGLERGLQDVVAGFEGDGATIDVERTHAS